MMTGSGNLLEERTCIGTWLYQLRPFGECYLLREAAEIHFPIRAWIDLGREALTSRDIIHEQRLGGNRGSGLQGNAVALQTPHRWERQPGSGRPTTAHGDHDYLCRQKLPIDTHATYLPLETSRPSTQPIRSLARAPGQPAARPA